MLSFQQVLRIYTYISSLKFDCNFSQMLFESELRIYIIAIFCSNRLIRRIVSWT